MLRISEAPVRMVQTAAGWAGLLIRDDQAKEEADDDGKDGR